MISHPVLSEFLLGKLKKRVQAGLARRAELQKSIEAAFVKLHPSKTAEGDRFLRREELCPMLNELGLEVSEDEAGDMFEEFDSNNSDTLDLDELMLLLRKPTRLYEWVKTLPLVELVVDAISAIPREQHSEQKKSIDPLFMVSEMSCEDRRGVCFAVRHGLMSILEDSCKALKTAFDHTRRPDKYSKFIGSIEVMSAGDINAFHSGIEARIGEDFLPWNENLHFSSWFCRNPKTELL